MKYLCHTWQVRFPRPHPVFWKDGGHARIVQDGTSVAAYGNGMVSGWKLAIAVREDLAVWQKANVAAFVASGIGPCFPELVGETYVDASGRTYLPKLGLPILLYAGDGAGIRRAFDRAISRELAVSVYTDDLFATRNDVENRAAVAAVATEDLVVAGFAVAGDAKQVDKVFDKLRFHP